MNRDHNRQDGTLPFASPLRGGRRSDKTEKPAENEKERQELLDIIKRQPEVDISRIMLLHGHIGAGRHQVNAKRVAAKLLALENLLWRKSEP